MALTRRMLKELGLEEESIEKIMTEHGKVLEGMTTKAQAEEEQKKALEQAEKQFEEQKKAWEENHKPIDVKASADYKELETKYNDLIFDTKLRDNKVVDKYKDFVKAKLNNDKPFDEAIEDIRKEFPEFFTNEQQGKPFIVGNGKNPKEETEADVVRKQFAEAFR